MVDFLNFLEIRKLIKKMRPKRIFVEKDCIRGADGFEGPLVFDRAEFLLGPHRIYFISDRVIAKFTMIKGGYVDVIDEDSVKVDIISNTSGELISLN